MPKPRLMGPRLRELRHQRGLTVAELGAAAGINPAYVSFLERDLRQMSTPVTARLVMALDVPPSDLVPRESDPEPREDPLVEALIAAEMDPDRAAKIQRNVSVRVRRALLHAMAVDENGVTTADNSSVMTP